jgi:uncharacterized protein YndB with AHSA1/START domain
MKMKENALTRRESAVGIAVLLGCALGGMRALGQQPAMEKESSTGASAARTSLHQEIAFNATPQRVFDALLDAKQFAAVTGMAAEIDPKAGGVFKTFGGLIEGRNVEIIAAQRIVQAWREPSWAPGFYSLVHFELTAAGTGTRLVLDHTGFAEGAYDHLFPGWHLRYWEPLKKYLARQG